MHTYHSVLSSIEPFMIKIKKTLAQNFKPSAVKESLVAVDNRNNFCSSVPHLPTTLITQKIYCLFVYTFDMIHCYDCDSFSYYVHRYIQSNANFAMSFF